MGRWHGHHTVYICMYGSSTWRHQKLACNTHTLPSFHVTALPFPPSSDNVIPSSRKSTHHCSPPHSQPNPPNHYRREWDLSAAAAAAASTALMVLPSHAFYLQLFPLSPEPPPQSRSRFLFLELTGPVSVLSRVLGLRLGNMFMLVFVLAFMWDLCRILLRQLISGLLDLAYCTYTN